MKKVLVVVDMQNDFVDGALGTKEAQAIVENVVKKVQAFKGEIIFTKDTHPKNYLETQEGHFLPVEHCIEGSDGWQIIDALKPYVKTVITKPTFGSIDLATMLKEENVESIELIGLCTDICVVSNALLLKASMPEISIHVDASCCAGVTPEKHQAALETMKSCQIIIHGEL